MPENKKIAIVILNWNGEKLFPLFLPSVMRYSLNSGAEIVVADNGSTDNSLEYLNTSFPKIKTIRLGENLGFAEGYNRALQQVDAEYYVLLNSDVEVTPGWLEPCIRLLEKKETLGAIQPKILSYHHKNTFEYAGAGGGFIDRFGYPFCRGRMLNRIEKDDGQYSRCAPIFWASGACMFIRAEAFHKAGGFDGDFWAHMEEIDLCWRLKSLGYEIINEPGSTVYHLGGGTLSYSNPLKVYLNFRNNLWMLFKNLPRHRFNRIFFTRMILDGIAAVKFLAGLHFQSFWAVLKAHASFYRNLPKLIQKRKQVQSAMKVKDHPEIYRGNIMWRFFICRQRKFSELNFNPGENE